MPNAANPQADHRMHSTEAKKPNKEKAKPRDKQRLQPQPRQAATTKPAATDRKGSELQLAPGAAERNKHCYHPRATTDPDRHKATTMPRLHRTKQNHFIGDLHTAQHQPSSACLFLLTSGSTMRDLHPLQEQHQPTAEEHATTRSSHNLTPAIDTPAPPQPPHRRSISPPDSTPAEPGAQPRRWTTPKRSAPCQHNTDPLPQARSRPPQRTQVPHPFTHHSLTTHSHASLHPRSHTHNYTQSHLTTSHTNFTSHKQHTMPQAQTGTHPKRI